MCYTFDPGRPSPNIRGGRPAPKRAEPIRKAAPARGDARGAARRPDNRPVGRGDRGRAEKDRAAKKEPVEDGEKKFDPTGYDKDLVENLERDIVQKNPNVHWYVNNFFSYRKSKSLVVLLFPYT